MTLADRVPPSADPDDIFESFVAWTIERGIELYPAQEEAVLELVTGNNVILNTPTGSGKSMVAIAAHFAALARNERSYYTAPIKALVSEKFFALVDIFGADKVGMATGDASVNADAPIICCTAEVLANLALREGDQADVGAVIMDEFHFYSEPERGWAWQVPLIELTKSQFLLMSATLGDVTRFERDLTRRTGTQTVPVSSAERPIPLTYQYVTTPLHETLDDLLHTQRAPVYIVHATQAAAVEQAQNLMSINVSSKAEKAAIAELIGDFRFTAGFGRALSRLVRHGIGVHHAGMLPKYRRLVEQLAQAGLLKVVCGTDTLGVGINVPIRTVLFIGLAKFDGVKMRHYKAREFHQIAGRAGRAGYDTSGTVVSEAPEYQIENARLEAKIAADPNKKKKLVRKKPPEGFISWSENTFKRLIEAEPEALTSSFKVTHSMLLNVLQRQSDPVAAMRHLLDECDESAEAKRKHTRRALAIYRALRDAGIVTHFDTPDEYGAYIALAEDLQLDFALNQPLSPFALAAFDVLDPESDTYALDILSIVESTLEDPRQVLYAQENKAKGDAITEMKAEGIEYEQRMELLEKVTWPKPLTELLEPLYETYRRGAPWVSDYRLSPKSIVRDLYERAMTFVDFIGFYGLARSEGLVLRYLSDAYKALRQTVPEDLRTEELEDLIEWLGEMVRQVDSSLIEEWERLREPTAEVIATPIDEKPPPVTANERAFRVLVRNAMFRRVEMAALQQWTALRELDATVDWYESVRPYFEEHAEIGTGSNARGPSFLHIQKAPGEWRVRQIFDDPAGDHDWGFSARVDLAASDDAGEAVLEVTSVGQL